MKFFLCVIALVIAAAQASVVPLLGHGLYGGVYGNAYGGVYGGAYGAGYVRSVAHVSPVVSHVSHVAPVVPVVRHVTPVVSHVTPVVSHVAPVVSHVSPVVRVAHVPSYATYASPAVVKTVNVLSAPSYGGYWKSK